MAKAKTAVAPKPKKDGSDARPENCWHRAVQAGLLAAGAAPVEQGGTVSLAYGSDERVSARLDIEFK